MDRREWVEMTEEVFNNVFKNSPLQRARYTGLRRNVDFVTGSSGATSSEPVAPPISAGSNIIQSTDQPINQ